MVISRLSSGWLKGLIDFVFPPLCLGCSEYTENESGICDTCFEAIDTYDFPFCLSCLGVIGRGGQCPACEGGGIPLYAFGNYTDPLEQIIIQFKFRGITRPVSTFARTIAERFGDDLGNLRAEALLPVPLHSSREIYRGYNQAEVFARSLSEVLELEVREDLIMRTKKRHPQARLSLRQRASNVRGVFARATDSADISRVILVDDVVTSGSTAKEAVRLLGEMGVRVVAAVCIAHAR